MDRRTYTALGVFGFLGLLAVVVAKRRWQPPETAAPYLEWLNDANSMYGLPHNLLARVAWQESRFREDIITGKLMSHAGAQGLMQIVPRWHPNVDPLNPEEAIYYAARYLRNLYDRMGSSWKLALASYNWGPGNVLRHTHQEWPKETRDYVRQISQDIPLGDPWIS